MPKRKAEDQVETETVEQAEVEVDQTEVAIEEAFTAAVGAESEEDAIKMAMIQAGATFKNVTRLYNALLIEAGLAVSKEDKEAIVNETLEGAELATEEGFDGAVSVLVEKITGATERSAAALIRSYCKKNELECYAKPKSAGNGSRGGFATDFYAYLLANPTMSAEEALAFVNGEGDHKDTSDNIKKHASHYMAIHSLVGKVVANAS